MTVDKHTLAIVSIVGSSLDVLGSLYLAYDLLGGEYGPLRTLTRAVTYGVLFGAGYGVVLGPVFGLACGLANGITLAWELARTSRHLAKPGFWYDFGMSAVRACGFALGSGYLLGAKFGITFGALSTAGQIIAYRAGIRPSLDYAPATRPHISRSQFLAALNRTVGYGIAGYVSALAANQQARALALGVEAGLVVGAVTAVFGACMPVVEWMADHMPAKRMGIIGVGLIVVGFALQSIQYWLALMNVNVQ